MKDLGRIHFFRRGAGRRNPYEHECKISRPSLYIILVLKNVTLPREAVKVIVTHLCWFVSNLCLPFLGRQKVNDPPLNSFSPPPPI